MQNKMNPIFSSNFDIYMASYFIYMILWFSFSLNILQEPISNNIFFNAISDLFVYSQLCLFTSAAEIHKYHALIISLLNVKANYLLKSSACMLYKLSYAQTNVYTICTNISYWHKSTKKLHVMWIEY